MRTKSLKNSSRDLKCINLSERLILKFACRLPALRVLIKLSHVYLVCILATSNFIRLFNVCFLKFPLSVPSKFYAILYQFSTFARLNCQFKVMGEFNSDGLFLKTKTNILVRNYG